MSGYCPAFSFESMRKTKCTLPPFPALFRRSDRSHLLLALFLSITLGVTILLVSLGKQVAEEASRISIPKSFFELKLRALVLGHPIERMIPFIIAQDRDVATFLIAIGKKESNWGKFAPEKDGKACYNYWGYRGPENTTDSGYSCFDSPGEAVATVGARLRTLLDQGLDTPRKLVVWKRGFVDTPLDPSEEKWVSDVAYYADEISR